jgi:hypothetical protein
MVIFSWSAKKKKKQKREKRVNSLVSTPTTTNMLTCAPSLALFFFYWRVGDMLSRMKILLVLVFEPMISYFNLVR